MLAGNKIRLYPTQEQEVVFLQNCNTTRFIYNACLAEAIRAYNEDGIFYSKFDLMSFAGSLKYDSENIWLRGISSGVVRKAAEDVYHAFNMFYKGVGRFPKFKKKGKNKLSFGLNETASHCRFLDNTHLKFSRIKKPIRIRPHKVPSKIYSPRVIFDGKYWYFTYSYEVRVLPKSNSDRVIGVDLGIKSLAVTSDGVIYNNINKSKRVKQLEKRKCHLQRKISRKYEANKQGKKFVKTHNILKLEKELKLVYRRLKNIRDTYIHQVTYDLVKTKPGYIVIEDLNVKGMMKNKHLSKAIQEQEFYKFRQYLTYKCQYYGVELIVADRFFPSSKICSCCGFKKKFLSLSERTFICPECGQVIDRDLNASINLRNYALSF